MHRIRWLLGLVMLVGLTGCVKQSEFDEHTKSVKESGEAVDAWIKAMDPVIRWTHQKVIAAHCNPTPTDPGGDCDPPMPPAPPPPDGGWGGGA